jgi:NAD-dependent deacetylase
MPTTFPQTLLTALRSANHIAVLTGAGVSAESGIATFRDALTGLWSRFKAEDLATPYAFVRDPATVTQWYDHRRLQAASCSPNPGHFALAKLQAHLQSQNKKLTLITQNVDQLHQRAGSTSVLEMHGNIHTWRCIACHTQTLESGPAFPAYPPRCTSGPCRAEKRPDVVWFGESLDPNTLNAAAQAAKTCDLFLSLGTSSVVHPAAGLIDIALQNQTPVLEINLTPTDYTPRATWSFQSKTGELLPDLVAQAI